MNKISSKIEAKIAERKSTNNFTLKQLCFLKRLQLIMIIGLNYKFKQLYTRMQNMVLDNHTQSSRYFVTELSYGAFYKSVYDIIWSEKCTKLTISTNGSRMVLIRYRWHHWGEFYCLLPNPNVLVAISTLMQAVNLCSNKSLQFLTVGAS